MPKGAVHGHQAIASHHITGKLALDLHPRDVFWCTADPGWVTGTSYGIISPLSNGVTMIVDEADFDAQRWYEILESERVSVWYTAPTAIRMLMKSGVEIAHEHEFPALRFLASVGEPLNAEGVVWGEEAFGLPFHDNWWQTETGGIIIANFASMDVRPGSTGKPVPSVEAGIVHKRRDGGVDDPERYAKCFADGWYLTGDLARRDEDGYYWFISRADDVIKTSGHLIGPFEVESVMLEHPAVAEAGVIGKPDPVAGEVVKAFVTLKPGYEPSHALEKNMLAHVRIRLSAVVAPKGIDIVEVVPRTRSGKTMRRLLKALTGRDSMSSLRYGRAPLALSSAPTKPPATQRTHAQPIEPDCGALRSAGGASREAAAGTPPSSSVARRSARASSTPAGALAEANRLRDEQAPERQPRDQVRTKPATVVLRQPRQGRHDTPQRAHRSPPPPTTSSRGMPGRNAHPDPVTLTCDRDVRMSPCVRVGDARGRRDARSRAEPLLSRR